MATGLNSEEQVAPLITPSAPRPPSGAGATAALRPLSLRCNFSWAVAGNIVYAGCQWGMLVILAKLGTPEMVGQFVLGLAVTAPVIMFANLQLRAVQVTDANRQYQFGDYFALRLVTTALAFLVIAALASAGGHRRETALVIIAMGVAKGFESISDVVYGLLQRHERRDCIARLQMIKGLLSLAAMGAAVYLTGSPLWGAVALAVAWLLRLVAYEFPIGARILGEKGYHLLRPRWDAPTLARLAWLALPLGFVMMLISLNTNIPRYFIGHFRGERELGIFAALAYLIVTGDMVVSALGQSATPRLARHYADGDLDDFRRLLMKLVAISALLGTAGIILALSVGRTILTALYSPEYAERSDVFAWLMIMAPVSYVASSLGYGMTAARYFRIQMPLSGLVAITLAIASEFLVPAHGLRGAAWAWLLALVVQLAGSLGINTYALRKGVLDQP